MSDYKLNYRISTTEIRLGYGHLFAQGIPVPDIQVYNDSSSVVSTGDGGETRHGYLSVTWTWNRLSFNQIRIIKGMIDYVQSNDLYLYMTVDRGVDGSGRGDWIDVKGKPRNLQQTVVSNSNSVGYDNVTLYLNNLVIVNDPSTV